MVDLNDILKMEVIDNTGQEIGKVNQIEFDEINGEIKNIEINLDKGLFSSEKRKISYDKIRNITDNVLLDIVIDMDH